jgi:hypothetical protein
MEASATTKTERELDAEKAGEELDVDAPNTGAPGGAVNPPDPPPDVA